VVSGFGGDLGVEEIIAVGLLRVLSLGPLEERPGVLHRESIYITHGENPTVPSLAVDWNGVDDSHGGGTSLGCGGVSERTVTRILEGPSHARDRKSPSKPQQQVSLGRPRCWRMLWPWFRQKCLPLAGTRKQNPR